VTELSVLGIIGLGILLYLFRNVIGTLLVGLVWVILLFLGLSLVFRFL
jgi:hypothetical protein